MAADSLPSGHNVKKNSLILVSLHAMGRIKWIWGEDCEEFKPERWIAEDGGFKNHPGNKFSALNFCLQFKAENLSRKEVTFILMKAVVASIFHN
ncbi:hypothetical protein Pint_26932 [Pistacia integerrima]|uniref:Uncharacterized protein n=1 Tax=Pistacia integerrima TaxID=434235 RepID=A0ACC0YQ05_9ROSI|nr:hypothetical protein Pint_26932 [Pistacia integerrima]